MQSKQVNINTIYEKITSANETYPVFSDDSCLSKVKDVFKLH